MIHLYCLAVQAGFYSDAGECSPVTQTARVRYPAAALVIGIFSPVTSCSSDKYMIHLYCLAVQAGFYSDVVECLPFTQTARVRFPAVALVIRIFSPVTSGHSVTYCDYEITARGLYKSENTSKRVLTR